MIVARGPIDSLDAKAATVSVMGRTLAFARSGNAFSSIQQSLAGGSSVQITVFAKLTVNGALKTAGVALDSTPYVSGASEVVAAGRVSKLDVSSGRATVGGVVIDYTGLLASHDIRLNIGDLIVVHGTRPAQSSPVQATRITSIGK